MIQEGKSLFRNAKDGRVLKWSVEDDDSLFTLQEAFQGVDSHLGFNIELKFDDHVVYREEELTHALQAILQVWFLKTCCLLIHESNSRSCINSEILEIGHP